MNLLHLHCGHQVHCGQHGEAWYARFLPFVGFACVTLAAVYFVVTHNQSSDSLQMQFARLTDADIEMIQAVKAEMQKAKIQANPDD